MVLWFVVSHRLYCSPTSLGIRWQTFPVSLFATVILHLHPKPTRSSLSLLAPQLLFTKYPACGMFDFLFPRNTYLPPQVRIDCRRLGDHWLINGCGNGIQLNQKRCQSKGHVVGEAVWEISESTKELREFGQARNLGMRCDDRRWQVSHHSIGRRLSWTWVMLLNISTFRTRRLNDDGWLVLFVRNIWRVINGQSYFSRGWRSFFAGTIILK